MWDFFSKIIESLIENDQEYQKEIENLQNIFQKDRAHQALILEHVRMARKHLDIKCAPGDTDCENFRLEGLRSANKKLDEILPQARGIVERMSVLLANIECALEIPGAKQYALSLVAETENFLKGHLRTMRALSKQFQEEFQSRQDYWAQYARSLLNTEFEENKKWSQKFNHMRKQKGI